MKKVIVLILYLFLTTILYSIIFECIINFLKIDQDIVYGIGTIFYLITVVIEVVLFKRTNKSTKHINTNNSIIDTEADEEDKDEIVTANQLREYNNSVNEEAHSNENSIQSIININRNYLIPRIEEVLDNRELGECLNYSYSLQLPALKNDMWYSLDLSKCSSLLIHGLIESGKSSLIHNIICSSLMTSRPDEIKFVIVDTRKLELTRYNGIPHLLCPVITRSERARNVFENIIREIERRYEALADVNVKNIKAYNEKLDKLINEDGDNKFTKMSQLVVIVDELNDLLVEDKKGITEIIKKILIDARAVGVYLICSINTLSKSVVDKGFIDMFNNVISFKATFNRDSILLFDNKDLLSLNDYEFLFRHNGIKDIDKYKESSFTHNEIERIINYVCKEQPPQYDETITQVSASSEDDSISTSSVGGHDTDEDDPLYNEIVDFCIETGKVSASLLQRRFRLGYGRACRIVDVLEDRGIIGSANGSKPREVLVKLDSQGREKD